MPVNKNASLYLRSSEIKQLAQIANESSDIASAEEFRRWAQSSVRKLFPHEALVAGLAHRHGAQIRVERLVCAGFPVEFIDAVTRRRGAFACPTLEAWFAHNRPQLFDPRNSESSERTASEFEAYDLKNVAANGVLSPTGNSATYFSFSRVPHALTERHGFMLELLVPHLHRAYVRALAAPNALVAPRLTRREEAVLRELSRASSTKAVAHVLGTSEHTVKHQVNALLRKLGASDRAEAVTTAVRLGLLPDRRQLF